MSGPGKKEAALQRALQGGRWFRWGPEKEYALSIPQIAEKASVFMRGTGYGR